VLPRPAAEPTGEKSAHPESHQWATRMVCVDAHKVELEIYIHTLTAYFRNTYTVLIDTMKK